MTYCTGERQSITTSDLQDNDRAYQPCFLYFYARQQKYLFTAQSLLTKHIKSPKINVT